MYLSAHVFLCFGGKESVAVKKRPLKWQGRKDCCGAGGVFPENLGDLCLVIVRGRACPPKPEPPRGLEASEACITANRTEACRNRFFFCGAVVFMPLPFSFCADRCTARPARAKHPCFVCFVSRENDDVSFLLSCLVPLQWVQVYT